MASYNIKFLCSLFITGALFCFADGGIPLTKLGPFIRGVGKAIEGTNVHEANPEHYTMHAPEDTLNPFKTRQPENYWNKNLPSLQNPDPKPLLNPVPKPDPKTFGVNLATRYFGKDFIKGFRWGYKVGKRIHSIASKCEKVMDTLNSASCPKPNPLLNNDIVNCVVEVSDFNGLDGTCLQTYESSQVPPEATCNLDEPATLDPRNCVKIKP